MNPNTLIVFYGICGVLITGLLVRIWLKNRKAKQSTPVVQTPTVASESQPVTRSTYVPANVVSQVAEPEPVGAASSVPSPYIASTSYVGTTAPVRSSWEDRRLLENRGILSRPTEEHMPRVLANEVPGVDDGDRTFGSMLNPTLAAMLPDTPERQEEARKELCAAGYYNPHALENLAALRYTLMMLSIIFFGVLVLLLPARFEPLAVAGLVIGPILGWALPMLQIRSKAAERTREINRAMPDLLDMLNMCVSQGLTVTDAMRRIVREFRGVYPALSQELSIVLEQARINDLHTALESFGKRINLPEVHSFTSLLIQTDRMGTSVTQSLTTYSDTMRESLKQRADEKGNRATFRLLFPTVLCLMPAVYLFLLGPAVNELSKFFNQGGVNQIDGGSRAIQRLNTQRGIRN